MSCFRFAAVLVGLVLLLTAAPVRASDDEGYLALGASFPFGFDPRVTDRSDPDVFVGYPETLAEMLDLDGSCPGETSTSFISLAVDSVCKSYRAQFPLHVDYTTSQLDFAVTHLREHPGTRLVTIEIGNNDLFLFLGRCASDPNPDACVEKGFPAVQATLDSNLKIVGVDRLRLKVETLNPEPSRGILDRPGQCCRILIRRDQVIRRTTA